MEQIMTITGIVILAIVWYLFACMAACDLRSREAEIYAQRYRDSLPVDPDELVRREIEYAGVDMGVGIDISAFVIIQPREDEEDRVIPVTQIDGRNAWLERAGLHDEACNNFLMLMKEAINEDAVS